jgi:hypothetical protein
MAVGYLESVPLPTASASASAAAGRVRSVGPTVVMSLLIAAWFVIQVPAFLCMGLDIDINMYDVMARRVMAGDAHYRDLLETNFPGIVWLHILIRSVFGWSSVALRAADLAIVAGIVGLLTNWLPRTVGVRGRLGVAAVLFAFYFTTSEWCHCQRDIWMLLPCLVALGLRCRQADRMARSDPPSRILAWGCLEGVVWAAAFWIKPFVAVPALACWAVSVWNASIVPGSFRRFAADAIGVLAGGLVVGGMGIGWLAATGAWAAFVDVMFDWNREYFASDMCGASTWMTVLGFATRFFPWALIHLVAVPLAIQSVVTRRGADRVGSLRAAFYLAWLVQSLALQHFFDYVHTPSILLGIAVVAAEAGRHRATTGKWFVLFLILCAGWKGVTLTVDRWSVWSDCVRGGSTPATRERVAVLRRIHWVDLDRVADFLRAQDARDGEVTCFSADTVPLYNDLNLRPSTRFLFLEMHLDIFLKRRDVICGDLGGSRQKYWVCTVGPSERKRLTAILDGDTESDRERELKDRVVFRSGDLVVFRIEGSETAEWLDFFLMRS